MKKIALLTIFMLSLFALSGCSLFAPSEKEFSGSGITITLDDSFAVQETDSWPLFLSSIDHVFMGLRESKSDAVSVGINTLAEYMDLVLYNGGEENSTVYESDNGEYLYAYYTAQVDGEEFGYMLVCMQGANYYYLMNFGCYSDELDDNKDQYIAWANTIIVE
ncbi:MAG: hypothetical protein AB7U79_03575 [Candidatus Izemoplasmatales bacterium]